MAAGFAITAVPLFGIVVVVVVVAFSRLSTLCRSVYRWHEAYYVWLWRDTMSTWNARQGKPTDQLTKQQQQKSVALFMTVTAIRRECYMRQQIRIGSSRKRNTTIILIKA